MNQTTFLWHDYETFGVNPRRDRPAQFAAIRTDAALNEIGKPLMLYCQPANDFLPEPEACLITGITPQWCLEKGLPEYQFAAAIEQAMSQPGTVGVGYNTIRFDDEVTRFMFWRNLIDPYAREWQNNCGRWDLLDVVRMAYALRPEGIVWPTKPNENGKDGALKPSFKLTDLTAANGLAHESAHDALSDVRATIALARLIRTHNAKLWDFCFALHKKERVAQELGMPVSPQHAKPFLHVSGMFPPERGCLAVMWPLATHPVNKNEIIAWDLSAPDGDPAQLATLNVDEIRQRMFSRADDLREGVRRLPIKTVHLNKSPMVVGNLKTLTPAQAATWGVDIDAALRRAQTARDLPDMSALWPKVFAREPQGPVDVDEDLYGGFIGNADRKRLNDLRKLDGPQLAKARNAFDDKRLEELVFRYRARNFPASLALQEMVRWNEHRAARLFHGQGGQGFKTIDSYFGEIDRLSETVDERGEAILGTLYDWAQMIAPDR